MGNKVKKDKLIAFLEEQKTKHFILPTNYHKHSFTFESFSFDRLIIAVERFSQDNNVLDFKDEHLRQIGFQKQCNDCGTIFTAIVNENLEWVFSCNKECFRKDFEKTLEIKGNKLFLSHICENAIKDEILLGFSHINKEAFKIFEDLSNKNIGHLRIQRFQVDLYQISKNKILFVDVSSDKPYNWKHISIVYLEEICVDVCDEETLNKYETTDDWFSFDIEPGIWTIKEERYHVSNVRVFGSLEKC